MIRLRLLPCWGIVLLFVWISGYWKIFTAIFLMMSLHECAHMGMAHLCGYSFSHMDIFPFGFCAQIDAMGYGSVYRELLILLAGPCMHLFYPLLFDFLVSWGCISFAFCEYLLMLNRSILWFNLLPILPLDGGRIFSECFHLCLPYAKAQRLSLWFSLLMIFVVFVIGWMGNLIGWLTLFVLAIQIRNRLRCILQDRYHFYRYRYHHPFVGRPFLHEHQDLYRMRLNYIMENDRVIEEHVWLRRLQKERDVEKAG